MNLFLIAELTTISVPDRQFAKALEGTFPSYINAHLRRDKSTDNTVPGSLKLGSVHTPAYPIDGLHFHLPIVMFQNARMGIGTVFRDSDEVLRRIPLFYSDSLETYPSLIARAIIDYDSTLLEKTRIDSDGRIWLRYYGYGGPGIDDNSTFTVLPIAHLFSPSFSPDILRGKFVLVGGYSLNLADYHPTPFTSTENPFPGVEVQATMLSNILENDELLPVNGLLALLIAGLIGFWTLWSISKSSRFISRLLPLIGASIFYRCHHTGCVLT